MLFDPIGMHPVEPGIDGAGVWTAGYATNTTTRNFAKLGLLWLRGGEWDGAQLVSRDYIDFARTPSPVSDYYGGQIWLDSDGVFEMIGVGGQSVVMDPARDLVIASNNGGAPIRGLFAGVDPVVC